MMNYTHPIKKMVRVPAYTDTEPGLQALFAAIRRRNERKDLFNGDFLPNENKGEYLDSIKDELRQRSRSFKYQIYEIGKLLCEAKKHLAHGEFKPWIAENFEQGYRTAHNCMKVYLACMGHPEVVTYFNPSCLYLIAKPSFPEDLRESLFDGAKGPVDVDKKELVQLAMEYKNGEVSINDDKVQNILKQQRDSTLWEKYIFELMALNKLIDDRLKRIESLSNIPDVADPMIKDGEDGWEERTDQAYMIVQKIENFQAEINTLIQELGEKCN